MTQGLRLCVTAQVCLRHDAGFGGQFAPVPSRDLHGVGQDPGVADPASGVVAPAGLMQVLLLLALGKFHPPDVSGGGNLPEAWPIRLPGCGRLKLQLVTKCTVF